MALALPRCSAPSYSDFRMISHGLFDLPRSFTQARGMLGAAVFAACSSTVVDVDRGEVDSAQEAVAPVSRCAAESVAMSAIRVARGVTYVTRDGEPLQFDIAWSEGGP